jgi:hypothetical protein
MFGTTPAYLSSSDELGVLTLAYFFVIIGWVLVLGLISVSVLHLDMEFWILL